jgi:UDP-N-acetylmuramoylalanine-D-glutamate ligase
MRVEPPRAVVTMGQNGPRIHERLRHHARGRYELHAASELDEAVPLARKALGTEGVVLLSPGAPSFPRYRDYIERGRHFARIAGFDPDGISAIPGLGIA